MVFSYEQKEDRIYVKIAGVIENDTVDDLVNPMQEILSREFKEVVFDLSNVPFMTSAAIGKFLIFYKNLTSAGKKMRVKGIDEELMELFHDIKLDTFFPIER